MDAPAATAIEDSPTPLTIGIISRNGMPYIQRCLESLAKLDCLDRTLSFVLVDCVSTDGTTEVMRQFRTSHNNVRLFRVDGTANTSVARNVILDNTRDGYLFLLDGDIDVNPAFIEAALAIMEAGRADAVIGDLEEIAHDEFHRPMGEMRRRAWVDSETYVLIGGGLILLAPQVVRSDVRFDERQRRSQDLDFCFQLSKRFRILRIPVSMGTHLTQEYVSKGRISRFYREIYYRPMGRLVRKYWASPVYIWQIVKSDKGVFAALGLQLIIIIGLIANIPVIWVAAILILLADALRLALHGRFNHYLPLRIVAPWMVAYGFLAPSEPAPRYRVREVETVA
jgi:glycosyltransferase involved in cell wall biosynthesis